MRKKQPDSFGLAKSIVFLFLLTGSCVFAQLADMRPEQLLSEADLLLRSKNPGDAKPYLQEYLDKAASSEEDRVRSMAQDVRLKLASLQIQDKDFSSAIVTLEAYIGQSPRPSWNDAMKLLSTSLLETENFEKCIEITRLALAGPPAEVRAELTPAEAGAPTNAPKYKLDKYGEVIKGDDSNSVAADENPSGYKEADLLLLNMTLGEACLKLNRNQESIAPFSYVMEHTTNEVNKGYAIMQVVDALIKDKNFGRLTTLIPQLYRTNARYDIRVNLALMNAATALFDAKEYDNALPLYRMILPRRDLIAYQLDKINEIKIKAGIAPGQTAATYKDRMEESLFGTKHSVIEEEFWAGEDRSKDANKPKELIDLEQLVRTLESLPPYENEVLYRNALLYDDVGRPWEAARFYDRVYHADPESDLGLRAFADTIRVLLDPLDEIQEAEERGYAYLDNDSRGVTPRQVAYALTGYYQRHEQMPKAKRLMPYLRKFIPSADETILRYDCELYYMQAVADMVMVNYKDAEATFKKVLTDFPGSHQEDNASYWHAVSLIFLERYDEALTELGDYPRKNPSGAWLAGALFQSGTCLFALERYDEAMDKFTEVISKHTDAQVYPDACSLRGDIYGSKGLLDEAVLDYKTAIAAPQTTPKQDKYAVFQMAAVFDAEKRYPQIIAAVTEYLDRRGDQADIAQGIYWIGKTKINQGLVNEAVQSYFDAIIKYGSDIQQSGVDSIIAELVKTAKSKLSEKERVQLKARLAEAQKKTDSLTLQLRLRATVAQIDRKEIELGRQLIRELPNLDSAAPPALAAICDASFADGDYSRAEELLNAFIKGFDDSEYMRPAYKLRGFDLYHAGKLDEAMKLVNDAQGRYGTDYDASWAQVMKGDILLQKSDYEGARTNYLAVLNERGWRGEAYAEAAYKLGTEEEASGDPRKAFGWYQRTYVQYKGYAKGYWAAEAYLASARCLQKMGRENDARNTYRAMLFDRYVRDLPQATVAIKALGADEVLEIKMMIASGVATNVTVTLEAEEQK